MADMITQLPDDLLCYILSTLPAKQVAAMAVLSREWNLKAFLPTSLKIQFESTFAQDEASLNSFTNVMLLRSGLPSDLLKLDVHCTSHENPHPIEHLFQVAVQQRRVKHLILRFEHEDLQGYFNLPQVVMGSEYLTSLKIRNVSLEPIAGPMNVTFPSLKDLSVDISVPSDPSLQGFYNSCPVLEDLTLVGEVTDAPNEGSKRTFEVISGSLKRLTICLDAGDVMGSHGNKGPHGDYQLYSFIIDTPRLEALTIDEDLLAYYTVRNLNSLTEANIQVGWQDVNYQIPAPGNLNDIFTLLEGLTHVQTLTLNDRTLGVAGYLYANSFRIPPFFPVLSKLTLCVSNKYGWSFLPNLLALTPALEVLIIEMVMRADVTDDHRFGWIPPRIDDKIPKWFGDRPHASIKEVQLKGFYGRDELLAVVDYFQQIANAHRQCRQFTLSIT